MQRIFAVAALWAGSAVGFPVAAALVSYAENSVNDADGAGIAAVTASQFRELGSGFVTSTAPATWSSYRFTHWSASGGSIGIGRDAWGRAVNPATGVLTAATTLTAHYLPATRDSDADGVPDWFELEHFGNLDRAASDDSDGDGLTLAAESAGGTHPLYGNFADPGGVASVDSTLVTCNLAGYATYTLRSVPSGTVNQSGVVPPGTVVTTTNFSGNASFGHWLLDGTRQADAWGVAVTQLTFTVGTTDREAVAYLFAGDTDADGVSDAFEQRHYGTLTHAAGSDTDGDGLTLLAEATGGTHPLYANTSDAGGVAWIDSALVTCNLTGYPTYTLRSVPAGTVNQSGVVPPGTEVTTVDLSGAANFGYWTLDGVRQQDAWGVALAQIRFVLTTADREAVAYLFAGDTDGDGVSDAIEQRYYGTLAQSALSDTDGDGLNLAAEVAAGQNPLYGNRAAAGGVAWVDSALVTLDLQGDLALFQPAGDALSGGGERDFGAVLVGQNATLTFTVRNTGGRPLTGLSLTLDGANAARFAIEPTVLSDLAHLAETTFVVRFSPVSIGAQSAALHLSSNDPDENPFTVTLAGTGANNPPTLSAPADMTTPRNTATVVTVTLGDVETPLGELGLSATSSDPDVMTGTAIVFSGTGPARTMTLTPNLNATGTTRITLTVDDGELTTSTTFDLEVIAYPPDVRLLAPDELTSSAARLLGEVGTEGFATEAWFEFGPSTESLTLRSAELAPADGDGTRGASLRIDGLQPWTIYHYRLRANSSQGGSVTEFGTFRTAGTGPEIVAQPESQTVTAGEAVSFSVVATGVPAPAFVWWKDDEIIAGADEATLHFGAVLTVDAGTYAVVVSNAAGSVTSRDVTLTVQRRAQTILFDLLPGKQTGDAPFVLGATASSGLPVSYVSSEPAVATVTGSTVTIIGAGATTITASQAGNATYLPAAEVSRQLVVTTASALSVLLEDEFDGAAGTPPTASLYQWGGDVALNGAGQLGFSTDNANQSWLRTIAGRAVGAGGSVVVRFRAYAYAEDWNPGVYGDRQPRGLRVGTDPDNAVEFYSVTRTLLGMRLRRDGVETSLTHPLPGGVDTMNDYEITVTASTAVFRVNGELAGTLTGPPPSGALNVYFSTSDGGAGNVPMTVERLSLATELGGFDLWRVTHFEPAELLDESLTGATAIYAADGLPNLVKYALGLEPKQSHSDAVMEAGLTATDWIATFRRPAAITDVSCVVQASTNLTDWTTDGVAFQRGATVDGVETWQASYPRAGTPRLFFRLKVTRP